MSCVECVNKSEYCGFLSPGERGQPGCGDGPDAAGRNRGSSEGQSGQSAGDAGKDQRIVSASGFCLFCFLRHLAECVPWSGRRTVHLQNTHLGLLCIRCRRICQVWFALVVCIRCHKKNSVLVCISGVYKVSQNLSGLVRISGVYKVSQNLSGLVRISGVYKVSQNLSVLVRISGVYKVSQNLSGLVRISGVYKVSQKKFSFGSHQCHV